MKRIIIVSYAVVCALALTLLSCNNCATPVTPTPTPSNGESQIFFNYSLNINSVQIFTALSDGSNQRQWNTTSGFITSNIWSAITAAPRAGKIAFTAGEYKENAQLILANTDGSNAKVLVPSAPSPNGQILFPVLAPDASKVAFMRAANKQNIYLVNADGTGETLISTNSFAESFPIFSPDGKHLAYYTGNKTIAMGTISYDNGKFSVGWQEIADSAAIFADGGSRLDWSPDSKEIVYVIGVKGVSTELWVYNRESNSRRKITTGICAQPVWSPDGAQIAYSKMTSGAGSQPSVDILTVHPDGSGEKNITNTPNTIEQYAQWSPDGKKLVYNSYPLNYGASGYEEAGNLMVIDLASLTQKLIATNVIFGFFAR